MTTITINAGTAKYINEIPELKDGLPNGILNKRQTNVGGTTGCITSDDPYIISVPSVTLIKNKCAQHSNIFGVYEGIKYDDFRDFILNGGNKIMVTYDSTPKVTRWLRDMGINPYNTYKVLVDEYHKLLTDYSYRDAAISALLQDTVKYDWVTYMSATPIDEEYTPDALSSLPHYVIEWPSEKVKVKRYKTNKPFNAAVNIIKKYKAGGYSITIGDNVSNEAYFFVNSVTSIKDICDNAGLTPSEVKVVCADTAYNKEILEGYEICTPEAPNKPFTFVTSLAFLGCDFYSTSGVIFIITSTGKRTTLLDISTDIAQIAGRIRNADNPFKGTIYHIYNTRMADMNMDQFSDMLNKDIEESYMIMNDLNQKDEYSKQAYLRRLKMDIDESLFFFDKESKMFVFDDLKVMNLKFQYKVSHSLYNDGVSIRKAYLEAGMDVTSKQLYKDHNDEFLSNAVRLSWNELMKSYAEARLNDVTEDIEYFGSFERDFKGIYDKLGYDRLKALKFEKKPVMEEMYAQSDTTRIAVLKALMNKYQSGVFVPSAELKSFLKGLYEGLNIKKTAKASDIMEYMPSSEECGKRIEGKMVKGYTINYRVFLGTIR